VTSSSRRAIKQGMSAEVAVRARLLAMLLAVPATAPSMSAVAYAAQ
jgi:hypothetical protein